MSKTRKLLIPTLASGLLLLSAAVELPSAPLSLLSGGGNSDSVSRRTQPMASKAPAIDQRPKSVAALPDHLAAEDAAVLLRRAADRYSPKMVSWLELTLWQRADCGEVHYEMEGRFLAAPKQQLRLELCLRAGPLAGRLLLVSNGLVLQESLRLPGAPERVTTQELPHPQEPGDNAAALTREREELLNSKAFRGIGPLLQKIGRNLRNPRLSAATWQGRQVLEIRGEWALTATVEGDLPQEERLGAVIQECRLYLDANTYWPGRIEWWGTHSAGQPLTLLVETEYRQPVVNRPLSAERIAQEFAVTSKR
jgi:hypothetical protein